jgi:thiamine-monophosphate kinase
MKRRAQRKAMGEFDLIALLQRELERARSRSVELGIGDDAALLRVGRERLVATVDDQVEGVHFDLRWLSLEDVGYRSLQAAASDLAAMAATPLAALASVHVPRDLPARRLQLLARGQALAARELGCPVVGGNITRGPVLSISTTVLGRGLGKALLRSGAQPGDELWLLGDVGLARAGLLSHQQRLRVPARLRAVLARARNAWARPQARIAAGRTLAGRARAALDVSDGLMGDVAHLARASGVRVVLEFRRISRVMPADLAELADLLGEPAVTLALKGGEDYALLGAGPRARRPARAKVIGRIERGRGSVLELESGQRFALGQGFDHLRR